MCLLTCRTKPAQEYCDQQLQRLSAPDNFMLHCLTDDAQQTFSEYFAAEMNPGPSFPTADVVWGQTERDRV